MTCAPFETVRFPLLDAPVIERREISNAIAEISAGRLCVAVCHDYTGRFGAYRLPRQYSHLRKDASDSRLKPVIVGSTTMFDVQPYRVEGMHQDDHTRNQVDAHYTFRDHASYRAVFLDTKRTKTPPFPTNKDGLDSYPALDISDDEIELPAEIAEITTTAFQVYGDLGTLVMWGGKNGFSHPHQFNSGPEQRLSRVFALTPRRARTSTLAQL